jgi:hypothetical protein
MVFVTTLFVLTTTGERETVPQTAGKRFVVDFNVKPVAFVGHVKMTLVPE